jgi:hypothetical protein
MKREAFFAMLQRLEERPVDPLLIEIGREIGKCRRDRQAPLSADRQQLWESARAEIVEILARILEEGKRNAFLRTEVAEILGTFEGGAEPAVPALVGALGDEVSFVRVAACEALGRLGTAARAAVEPLRTASRGEDPDLRRAARKALGSLGSALKI